MTIPPGQVVVDDFPRFGIPGRPPRVPDDPVLRISGAGIEPLALPLSALAQLPRKEVTADFHCVSGWTATDLHWEGVAFVALYEAVIAPALPVGTVLTHVIFQGLDRYRSIATIDDALTADVLLAEHLDGRPLDGDHGAPIRVISPQQYGFISTKHLCVVELHTTRPRDVYHPVRSIQLGLQLLAPHPRARVWLEERHRYLPARMVRPVYARLIRFFRSRNTPGDRPQS